MNKYLIHLIFIIISIPAFNQENILTNGNMESPDGWTIYQLGANDANYEFNYTVDGPSDGIDGCLRVTSDVVTNILFWQELTLEAGKSYVLDGAVKTGNVASFWCELYLSTVTPQEGTDYSPNNNNDVVLGLTTWGGCGPNLDGLFSEVACVNRGLYIPPGEFGDPVTIYFGLKTGILQDQAMIEVLLDEFTLGLVENWFLISSADGILDNDELTISEVSPLISVTDFKEGLVANAGASVEIIGEVSGEVIHDQDNVIISDTMKVRVYANQITDYDIELRAIGTGNDIISALTGIVNLGDLKVTDLPDNALVIQLKTSITVSPYATYKIEYSNGQIPESLSVITSDIVITVIAENGDEKEFTIEIGAGQMDVDLVSDSTGEFSNISNKILELSGNVNWNITGKSNPLPGTIIDLKSDDIWLYFDSIKPVEFYEKYFDHLFVNGESPVLDEDIRLVQYLQGSVVISHTSQYKPLEVFDDNNLTGSSMELGIYNYYRVQELGEFHDSIQSFRLKRGYMATFARNEDGTGYSRVYIADNEDVIVNEMPDGLFNEVSFVRVFPWRWVHKKGWTNGQDMAEALNCSWNYDWGAGGTSTLNIEYVPMRHNLGWDAFSLINAKTNTTHVLGYNEPDRPDQSDMTVDQALAQWPQLLRSGLRLGSPSPSDGGLNWLYQFIDRADELNYRVDFVAVHWYRARQTPRQYYDFLKTVHDRTNRPIWITEWNNGANWTPPAPTFEEQAIAIEGFLHMLDTTSFVERYSLYEWVEEVRQMFYNRGPGDPLVLTPAGKIYRDKVSPMAFNPEHEFYKEYIPLADPAYNPRPRHGGINIGIDTVLTWSPGKMADSHRVFFGQTNPPTFIGVQTDTVYYPEELLPNRRYYWRIDEVHDGKVTTGNLWYFNTILVSSINEYDSKTTIKVYPQPVSGVLHIQGMKEPEIVEMYNMLGVKVFSSYSNGTINIEHLTEGIYLLVIKGYHPIRIIKFND